MEQENVVLDQEGQERAIAYKGAIGKASIWIGIAFGISGGFVLILLRFTMMLSVVQPVIINVSALSNEELILSAILGFLLMLVLGFSIQFYISSAKRQEYQADEFALQATRKVEVF